MGITGTSIESMRNSCGTTEACMHYFVGLKSLNRVLERRLLGLQLCVQSIRPSVTDVLERS